MKFACYKGTSRISKVIRFITRSEYSHVAVILRDGRVVEAWDGKGVRIVNDISDRHTPGTEVDIFRFASPLTPEEYEAAERFLLREIGQSYDWKGVFRFVTRKRPTVDSDWFCSELAFQASVEAGRPLLKNTLAFEVPPDLIPRSPVLGFESRAVTV